MGPDTGEGRDLSSRQTQYVGEGLGDWEPINSENCSEAADGVARESVKSCPKPDAGNLPVRLDERDVETEPWWNH
jgi:hypothetical protein